MKTVLAILIALQGAGFTNAAPSKPNVVIFYADDFGWGDIRYHNTNPTHFRLTPNMDRIFTEGVEFGNYMTHCVCSPSRAGLLTGRHYANVAAGPRTGGTLPNHIRNLAKDLQAAGYKTGAFGKLGEGLETHRERPKQHKLDDALRQCSLYLKVHAIEI